MSLMVSVSTWSSPPSISPAAWWSSVSSTPSCQPQTPQGWRSSLWGGCPDLSPPVSCNPGSPCRLSMECAQKERERCKCCNISLLFSFLFKLQQNLNTNKLWEVHQMCRRSPACRCCAPFRAWRAGHSRWQTQQRVLPSAGCWTGLQCCLERIKKPI